MVGKDFAYGLNVRPRRGQSGCIRAVGIRSQRGDRKGGGVHIHDAGRPPNGVRQSCQHAAQGVEVEVSAGRIHVGDASGFQVEAE